MRFKLHLYALHKPAILPFNYQYPLSSAIYKIIQRADHEFAAFLHNTGYGAGHKSFKLFTFSDVHTPFRPIGDRMQLLTGDAELIICFYMPKAAENFIKGLFINQQLEIADHRSKATFSITHIESLNEKVTSDKVLLQPLSPLVVGRKNSLGHYDYCSPKDADFDKCLYYNWMEKCVAVGLHVAVGDEEPEVGIKVLFSNHPPQKRLITIKSGTAAETKIRGYTKYRLAVVAPKEMLEVALFAGLGIHNAQGMGCMGLIDEKN